MLEFLMLDLDLSEDVGRIICPINIINGDRSGTIPLVNLERNQ